ncbi:HipA domain-containing protein [Idiomarina abyssalis]|uniref:HipA domain-containing protein n=1 Tax=Idiomarina abyssalis TaxID=86102 RepID=A0A8I1KF90_9GAMM|nr:HipA domain-containing protein [Idiomarina abyssalis]MBJ7265600.1 HipA domain-containing protein [Idiomarina abyssalis]MBJ7316726.1 HipA domain-containing protein [Idiomarina abyssalis]
MFLRIPSKLADTTKPILNLNDYGLFEYQGQLSDSAQADVIKLATLWAQRQLIDSMPSHDRLLDECALGGYPRNGLVLTAADEDKRSIFLPHFEGHWGVNNAELNKAFQKHCNDFWGADGIRVIERQFSILPEVNNNRPLNAILAEAELSQSTNDIPGRWLSDPDSVTQLIRKSGLNPTAFVSTIQSQLRAAVASGAPKDLVKGAIDYIENALQRFYKEQRQPKAFRAMPVANTINSRISPDNMNIFSVIKSKVEAPLNAVQTESYQNVHHSIRAATSINRVYEGEVYGITRPSLVAQSKTLNLNSNRAEYVPGADVPASGQQPKTPVTVQYHKGHYWIEAADISKKSTHLLKIPKKETGFESALGAREWVSMQLARAMGLDTPEFALVDMNKTTHQYTNPRLTAEHGGDRSRDILRTNRTLFVNTDELMHNLIEGVHAEPDGDFERLAGTVVEPPAYICEFFNLALEQDRQQSKVRSADFAELANVKSSNKFDSSFEEAANILRQHSSDLKADSERFVQRFLASWMLGDGDLHLANLSMVVRAKGDLVTSRLSPAYDIVSMAGLGGHAQDMALPVNGKSNPSIEDFMSAGQVCLDISPERTRQLASEMAMSCISAIQSFRNSETNDLSAPYKFQTLPRSIARHRGTKTSVIRMIHGIEMCLADTNLLPAALNEKIVNRIKSDDPAVYKEHLRQKGAGNDVAEPSFNMAN